MKEKILIKIAQAVSALIDERFQDVMDKLKEIKNLVNDIKE